MPRLLRGQVLAQGAPARELGRLVQRLQESRAGLVLMLGQGLAQRCRSAEGATSLHSPLSAETKLLPLGSGRRSCSDQSRHCCCDPQGTAPVMPTGPGSGRGWCWSSPVPWCACCAHPSTFPLPDGTERCQTQQGARVFFATKLM